MNLIPTEEDVFKMSPDLLSVLREQQSDEEREDILSGAPSRFEGCIRCEDLWVKPIQIQGAPDGPEPANRKRNIEPTPVEAAVPAEHA